VLHGKLSRKDIEQDSVGKTVYTGSCGCLWKLETHDSIVCFSTNPIAVPEELVPMDLGLWAVFWMDLFSSVAE
jgi:hypothetical protein